jgi:hypothetical protein
MERSGEATSVSRALSESNHPRADWARIAAYLLLGLLCLIFWALFLVGILYLLA